MMYGPFGMMGSWGGWGGGWFGPFHFIFPLLFWAVVITAIVMLVRYAIGDHSHHFGRRSSGLDVLEERYARGEINRDEYLQKKKDLLG